MLLRGETEIVAATATWPSTKASEHGQAGGSRRGLDGGVPRKSLSAYLLMRPSQ